MWKIIGAILCVTLIVLFISFNIDHVSHISFIVYTIEDIPVYLTIFISLLIGALAMLPVALGHRSRKKRTKDVEMIEQEINSTFEKKFADKAGDKKKKKRGKKKQEEPGSEIPPADMQN